MSDYKQIGKYYRQISYQAKIALVFVNDLLDYRMIQKDTFVKKLEKFHPKQTLKDMVKMFKMEA